MPEQKAVWSSQPLTGVDLVKDLTFRVPVAQCLIDVRTDAATNSDIGFTVTALTTTTDNITSLPMPLYTVTYNLSQMNNVIHFTPPFAMKTIRLTASSPTGAIITAIVFDLLSKERIEA